MLHALEVLALRIYMAIFKVVTALMPFKWPRMFEGAGSSLELVNGKSMGGIELTSPADRVTVSVKGANGVLVKEINLDARDAGITQFVWDGTDMAGTAVAEDGKYSFTVSAIQGTQKLVTTPLELAVVQSVERSGGQTRLNVGQQSLVSMNDIKQIY